MAIITAERRGIRQTGVSIGGMLAASAAPIALVYGWRWTYVLGGLLALLGGLLICSAYSDAPHRRETGHCPRALSRRCAASHCHWRSSTQALRGRG